MPPHHRLHPVLLEVTDRLHTRSRDTRAAWLERTRAAATRGPRRAQLACGNLAHSAAACPSATKADVLAGHKPGIALLSAYNDLLSAHQPFETYPPRLKASIAEAGGVAWFAGGLPAMCDGITQGQPGMELSLFSRDVIAMATAVALSHDLFDGALCLGVCDKIVPGMLMGALSFGHLPMIFVPAGPMASGMSNDEKTRTRKLYVEGRIDRAALLAAEAASYHGPGTCTFYGTANSNQVVMEVMGLHLPGSSFIPPNTPLRDALSDAAARRVVELAAPGPDFTPLAAVFDERAVVNGVVALLATGGSTNHTMHLVAMAAAAGIQLTWDDFADLSSVVPLLARIYPNGPADINHFHAAGGMGFLIGELLDAGLLHPDVRTVAGPGLDRYRQEPYLDGDRLAWRDAPRSSHDESVLRPVARPFAPDGGLRILSGNLGRAVIKVAAVAPAHRLVEAPARIFDSQEGLLAAFRRGELNRDVVVVVRFQGPKANGMPELHQLTPCLAALQDRGFRVALLTDGRMSGASGKIPAAIHVTPEAADGGPLARLRDGDPVRLDCSTGRLEALIDASELASRAPAAYNPVSSSAGMGRELFGVFRRAVGGAEQGASVFGPAFADLPTRAVDPMEDAA